MMTDALTRAIHVVSSISLASATDTLQHRTPSLASAIIFLSVCTLFLQATVAPAAAVQTDFLCQDVDDSKSGTQYSQFVLTLRNTVGALMVMGPTIGIVVFLFASAARGAQMSPDGGGTDYGQVRRDSLIYGFSVPVSAYMAEVLANAILAFNISCIVP